MIERSDFPDESGMNRSGDYPPRRIGNDYLRADRYSNDIDRHERRYGENNDNEYRYKSQLKPNGSSNSSHFNSDKKTQRAYFLVLNAPRLTTATLWFLRTRLTPTGLN